MKSIRKNELLGLYEEHLSTMDFIDEISRMKLWPMIVDRGSR